MNTTKPQVLLLSIKPQFAQKILDGQKQFELRKTKPKIQKGDFVLMYESSPSRTLLGWFEVTDIIYEKISVLWSKVGKDSGITKQEFDTYYEKSSFGVAIQIKDRCITKISLDQVRKQWDTFRPPQSFHYLNDTEISVAEQITNFKLPQADNQKIIPLALNILK